jgi:hypothetical protein
MCYHLPRTIVNQLVAILILKDTNGPDLLGWVAQALAPMTSNREITSPLKEIKKVCGVGMNLT